MGSRARAPFFSTEKLFIYPSVSVHVSRDATRTVPFIAFPFLHLLAMAGQLTAQANPLMAAAASVFGLAAVAASASLPVQATRDPISCVPLAHPFVSEASSAVGACAGQITVASYGNRGKRMGPSILVGSCGTATPSTCCAHSPLQFLFVHSGSQMGVRRR